MFLKLDDSFRARRMWQEPSWPVRTLRTIELECTKLCAQFKLFKYYLPPPSGGFIFKSMQD